MNRFSAFRIHNDAQGYRAGLEELSLDELPEGEVLVRVQYSAVNYKDALAVTGKAPIARRFPITGGIDAAGVVVESRDRRLRPGDLVVATGFGLGVSHDGGYAEYLRLPADWLLPLPEGMRPKTAMALGTAGLAAGLALWQLQHQGLRPDQGPVLVTGASGGVGSIALLLLAAAGFEAIALTGKPEQTTRLKALGAAEVWSLEQLGLDEKPLSKGRWAGVIDNLGGQMLSGLMGQMLPNSAVAAIGQAMGTQLHCSLMPFLLRGVGLLGIDTVNIPLPQRQQLWEYLARQLRSEQTDLLVSRIIGLETLPQVCADLMERCHFGRTLVKTG